MLAGGVVKFRAFPQIDGNVLEARILLPQGTPLARTEAVVTRSPPRSPGRCRDAHAAPARRRGIGPGGRRPLQREPDAYETGPHLASAPTC